MFDTSVTDRHGCNYCARSKNINTNGTNFNIVHFTENGRNDHFIQTVNNDIYHSLDIIYCPICGKQLRK